VFLKIITLGFKIFILHVSYIRRKICNAHSLNLSNLFHGHAFIRPDVSANFDNDQQQRRFKLFHYCIKQGRYQGNIKFPFSSIIETKQGKPREIPVKSDDPSSLRELLLFNTPMRSLCNYFIFILNKNTMVL
jgi:hypothetical protein